MKNSIQNICLTWVVMVSLTQAVAADINDMEQEFRDRSVIVKSSSEEGSAVIIGSENRFVLMATAYHVIEGLFADASTNAIDDQLSLVRQFPPNACTETLIPRAVWRVPDAKGGGDTDVAFVVAEQQCDVSLGPAPLAWLGKAPSLGVTMYFVDLISVFEPGRLSSPIFLANRCIQAKSCFLGAVANTQSKFHKNDSGSAVFSVDGLVGLTITHDSILSAPAIVETMEKCAEGSCEVLGKPVDISSLVTAFKKGLAPPQRYSESGVFEDIEEIQSFLASVPISQSRANDAFVCEMLDADNTTEIVVSNKRISITNTERRTNERCKQQSRLIGNETIACEANLSDLDPAIEIWSGPQLRLKCNQEADCFDCKSSYNAVRDGHPPFEEDRTYQILGVDLHIGRGHYLDDNFRILPKKEKAMLGFARALARVINNGDDKPFCNSSYPDSCR